ncbi:hypothetical protein [Paracoccus saliphilus]|uniref:Uncharacterized protein n=1 Tax=Paracoccus saliphilus TaxID=405559 RepID=A0AA45W542_9RHOB|nr:hypothetical protein [Paracoccus saliphilus]WCR02158.1 hypothetical protein JHX88_14770 [Paracoccus saliphilus]SIS90650.1 hypothetical protein SAMN05421772_10875 [Paracoccus saliphilus]
MSYLKGVFVQKEAERRALRDKMRDAFFADYSAKRLKDPMRIDADPATQHAKVLELIGIARGIHDENISGLDALEGTLTSLAVGMPTIRIGLPNQLTLEQVMQEGMERSHFNMIWAGWFDG